VSDPPTFKISGTFPDSNAFADLVTLDRQIFNSLQTAVLYGFVEQK